jgi:anti-anti-sigma regulatory factor
MHEGHIPADEGAGDAAGGAAEGGFLRLRASAPARAGRVLVAAQGDVDISTADQLRAALEEAYRSAIAAPAPHDAGSAAAPPLLVLDLREVGFADSVGLTTLMRARSEFKGRCAIALMVAEDSQPEHLLRLEHLEALEGVVLVHSPEELEAALAAL